MLNLPAIPKTIRLLLLLLLLPLINIITMTYMAYTDMQSITQAYNEELNCINESRWLFISGILEENKLKAKLQADTVKDKIEVRLLNAYYKDMPQLKSDIDNSVENSLAFKIMNDEIRGKFLNVENDNNDMFIASNDRILVDASINCSVDKTVRNWDNEIRLHSNKPLASQTIKLMVQQSSYLKFWEFLPSDNPKHIMLDVPSTEGLKRVYDEEGVKGLSTYEILTPSYLRHGTDIFNTPDVSNKGLRNENYKIIVVQGFNIVDTLTKNYSDKLVYFTDLETLQNRIYIDKKTQKMTELVLNLALLISSFIGIALTTKILIKWSGDDESCRY